MTKLDYAHASDFDAPVITVYLDGHKVEYAVEANAAEGWVEVLVLDDEGSFPLDENGHATVERLTGVVEIFRDDES